MNSMAGSGRGESSRPTPGRAAVGVLAALAAVVTAVVALALAGPAAAQVTGPVFVDGQAQPVFSTVPATWIRGALGRVRDRQRLRRQARPHPHRRVTRGGDRHQGLKVPVVLEVSPYYGGSVDVVNWAVDHEIGEPPATRPVTSPVFFNTSPDQQEPRVDLGAARLRGRPRRGNGHRALDGLPDLRCTERDSRPEGRDRLAERPGEGIHGPDRRPRSSRPGRPARSA